MFSIIITAFPNCSFDPIRLFRGLVDGSSCEKRGCEHGPCLQQWISCWALSYSGKLQADSVRDPGRVPRWRKQPPQSSAQSVPSGRQEPTSLSIFLSVLLSLIMTTLETVVCMVVAFCRQQVRNLQR